MKYVECNPVKLAAFSWQLQLIGGIAHDAVAKQISFLATGHTDSVKDGSTLHDYRS